MTHYKYHLDEDVSEYYNVGDQLGKGAFSVVKRLTCKETGAQYAGKIMTKEPENRRKQHIMETEIEVLKRVNHPNVVKLLEVFETSTQYILVLQIITGGELFDQIVELQTYSEKQASRCIRQILLGVKALHDNSIVHRDLKPENLLLATRDVDSDVLITDFGLSGILAPPSNLLYDAVGTPNYLAPEILRYLDYKTGYGPEVDMWAVGVILYILLCGFPPFFGDTEDEIYDKIEVGEYSFPSPYWDEVSDDAKDLISHLLDLDSERRFTADQALDHIWVKGDNLGNQHLEATVAELKKFNARRKWRGAVKSIIALQKFSRGSGFAAKLFSEQQQREGAPLESQGSGPEFGKRLLEAARKMHEEEEAAEKAAAAKSND